MQFSIQPSVLVKLLVLCSTAVEAYQITQPSKETVWYLERPCEVRWTTEVQDIRLIELYVVHATSEEYGSGHRQSIGNRLSGAEGVYNYPSLSGVQPGGGFQVHMVSSSTGAVLSKSHPFKIQSRSMILDEGKMSNMTYGRQTSNFTYGGHISNSTFGGNLRGGYGNFTHGGSSSLGGVHNSTHNIGGGGLVVGQSGLGQSGVGQLGLGQSGLGHSGLGISSSGGGSIHDSNQGTAIHGSPISEPIIANQSIKGKEHESVTQSSLEQQHRAEEESHHNDAPTSLQPHSTAVFVLCGVLSFLFFY